MDGGSKEVQKMPPKPPKPQMSQIPQRIVNPPTGLECLNTIDHLLVRQKVQLLEVMTGFEQNNEFSIKNSLGQDIYYAKEETEWITRNCCGATRPFNMNVIDIHNSKVIHFYRRLAYDSCCFPCCLEKMKVSSPPETPIGTVEQEWSIIYPKFVIKNAAGETVFRIKAPFCTYSMCGADVDFKIMSSDGQLQVGTISKQWSGFAQEAFTDADFFGITFPVNTDVRIKAVLLGACFLIDAMYYED